MRPPRQPTKMRQNQAFQYRNSKGNSCSNGHFKHNANVSVGSVNETKSSFEELSEKSMEHVDILNEKIPADGGEFTEPEPEWFTWPASRHDVIELHGFEEEDSTKVNESERPSSRNSGNNTIFDNFSNFNQRQEVKDNKHYHSQSRSSYNVNVSDGSTNSGHYQNAFKRKWLFNRLVLSTISDVPFSISF